MLVRENNGNNGYVVNATADVFIIPNGFSRYEFDFAQERAKRICKETLAMDVDSETVFGQFWMTSKNDLGSDNLNCHGFRIKDKIGISSGEIPENLPVEIFKDLKEGESIDITMNVNAEDYRVDEETSIPIELHLHVTAKQLAYRYRNFGRFEECFKRSLR